MGGCRCSYKNCPNSTKSTENVHFFHYPVKHKERCKTWIENANKLHFCDLEEDQLKNKVICEMHFEDKYFPNPQKKRLLQSAIPTLDGEATDDYLCVTASNNNKILQKSSEVQVLPANEDGTIFLLDTDAMYTRPHSNQVESYVYKNGVILPSNNQYVDNLKKIKMTGVKHDLLERSSNIQVLSNTIIPTKKVITPLNHMLKRPIIKQATYHHPSYNFEVKSDNIALVEVPMEYNPIQQPQQQQSMNHTVQKTRSPEKPARRSYLRQIKQHSKDIATIKRMLKQKKITQPDNNDRLLNILKTKLPSTLYTIVKMNLDVNCAITKDDEDFLKTIFSEAPNLYMELNDKYEWKLPVIVKSSEEAENDNV